MAKIFTSDIYRSKYRESGIVKAEGALQTDVSLTQRSIASSLTSTNEWKDLFGGGGGGTGLPDISRINDLWLNGTYLSPTQNRYWNKNMKH